VRVFGPLSVYEKSGQYQLIVRHLEMAGQGALQAAFEALKRKREAEGLFDPARKKPIPTLVRHLGIVTSPTGAALRQIYAPQLHRQPPSGWWDKRRILRKRYSTGTGA